MIVFAIYNERRDPNNGRYDITEVDEEEIFLTRELAERRLAQINQPTFERVNSLRVREANALHEARCLAVDERNASAGHRHFNYVEPYPPEPQIKLISDLREAQKLDKYDHSTTMYVDELEIKESL